MATGTHVTATIWFPDEFIATVRTRVVRTPKARTVLGFMREFRALFSGARRGMFRGWVASAAASQTVTCAQASAVADTDTIVIAGTTLTCKASVSDATTQWATGATNATMAANIVACINQNPTLMKIVYAAVTTSASGIYTVYCKYPGPIGNLVTLSRAGTGQTLGGSVLASGASDATKEYQFGYSTADHQAG